MLTRREYIILAILSIGYILVFSACSPLYPLNPWDDANCFTTIAKSMLSGQVLYRDIFDQKGPLLFLIHAASAWLFARPFLGICFLQMLSLFGFLVYGLKTMRLFRTGTATLPLMALIGLAYVTSEFYYYGDTVEELSMPALAYSFYLFLRFARHNTLPSAAESLVLGVGFAYVFWMKFTVLSMPLGSLVATAILVSLRHRWKELLPCIAWVCLGFFGLGALILLLFVPQGAVTDVLEGYFGYNLFHYHLYSEDTESEMGFFPLRWLAFAILVLPVCLVRTRPAVKLMVVLSWAFSLVLLAITTVYIYYFLVVFLFLPLLCRWWGGALSRRGAITMGLLAVLFAFSSFNLATRLAGTFPRAILEVAEDLKDEPSDTQILQYHSRETGLYTYSQFLAPVRIFFQLSVVHQDYLDEQEEALLSGRCKYVIMKDGRLDHGPYELVREYSEPFRPLLFIHPVAWLYMHTGLECLRPEPVENAIPTVAGATISTFRLYRLISDNSIQPVAE